MGQRPVIGIEVDLETNQKGRRYAKCYETYADAVVAAGGAPLLLAPAPEDALARVLSLVDGVIVPGGDDLAAEEWGEVQRPCPRFVATDARRLDVGRRLMRLVLAADLPFLGVCYGAQLLNLALGGTMVQDVPDEVPGCLEHAGTPHPIDVAPGSLLADLLGATRVEVNSRHHQSNREPGRGLVVSARSADGVVEAIEGAGRAPFRLGVQWHPEDLGAAAPGGRLFEGLVEAAGSRSASLVR